METKNLPHPYVFELPIKVRDYEVDVEGIVNNANYLHYLEHTRHEFCEQMGFSFSQMRLEGIDPVLSRAEIDYILPLRSGMTMLSRLWLERKGPRFIFHQDIFTADERPVLRAVITVVSVRDGRLTRGDEIARAFRLTDS